MEPYYEDSHVTIYHGDCREVLPDVEADLVVTDIPYGEVNRESSGLRSLDKGGADVETVRVDEIAGALSRFATSYVFCGTEQVSGLRAGFVREGLTTRLAIWEKSNPSPMNGDRLWLSSVECCVFARRPKATFHEFCASPVFRGPTAEESEHPTPKPRWLMDRLVLASSNVGDTVMDPFMGSGTTLVTAKNLGRSATGVDLEERWCEIAAERCSQGVLDLGGAA